MSKLDLEWLAVFDEVYKTGSVSKAADRLGMAQAAASTMLNKLRAHFDDRLFARTAQGMQPTPYAQRLVVHVREVLSQLDQARGSYTMIVDGPSDPTDPLGSVLAASADFVVLIATAGVTRTREIADFQRSPDFPMAKIRGIVLVSGTGPSL